MSLLGVPSYPGNVHCQASWFLLSKVSSVVITQLEARKVARERIVTSVLQKRKLTPRGEQGLAHWHREVTCPSDWLHPHDKCAQT